MAGKPCVVFINASPYKMAHDLSEWMRTLPCEVWETSGKVDWSLVSRYDLGLNFLGTHKIPASEIGDGRKWVNFHPAPLPEYGGRNVAYHAITEGAKCFGATVHYMSPEFDTGDIIECIRFPIMPGDTAGDLMAKAKAELVEMFKEWVPKLLQGPVPSFSQEGKTKYYSQQRIDDYVRLDPHQQIEVRARTCPPYCPKILIAGKTYKIIPEE
jgi:methionyl-tRNA formyltransferase